MFKVNNRRAVRKLALRQIKSSRKMNVVVSLSIVLTCLLFTALFSIGGGIVNSFQAETMRQVGGSAMAGVKYILPEDYEKIAADRAVKNPAYRIIVGNVANESLKNISVEVNCAQDEDAKFLFCYPTEGRMPRERNEIAMSGLALDELGIPRKIGENVPLKIDIDGKVIEENFTLCGFWPGDKAAIAQESFVSRQFCDETVPTPAQPFYEKGDYRYGGYWMMDFDFSNSWNIEEKVEKLMERCGYSGENEIDYGVNWAYVTDSVDTATLALIAFLLAVFLLAGYLMIYNVFYINVTANIRNYGLLKTIGTTGKQLKHMVRCQALIYSAVGIVPGFLIGTAVSRLLLPVIMKGMFDVEAAELSLSIWIYAAAAAFTLATVLLSCLKPCRYAASVTPIEALRHSGVSGRRKRKRTSKVNPFSMARANLSRTKRKTAVVVLSLSLSIVVLNLVYTAVRGFDADKYIRNLVVGDFMIGDSSVMKSGSLQTRDTAGVKEDDIAYFRSLDGVTSVADIYCSESEMILDGEHYDRVNGFLDGYSDPTEDEEEDYSIRLLRDEQKLLCDTYGVDRPAFDLIAKDIEGADAKKFFGGGYAIVYTYHIRYRIGGENAGADQFYEPGDTVQVELPDGTAKKYTVMAVAEFLYPVSLKAFSTLGAQAVIPDSDLLGHRDEQGAMYTVLGAEEEKLDEIGAELETYVTEKRDSLAYTSKQTYLEEFRGFRNIVWILGGSLSLILAMIGILNFINAVVTGIFARQHEFAAMQAVGMTGRQLGLMLVWEGVFYALFTAAVSIPAGGLIGKYVLGAFMGDMFFFTYHFTLAPILCCIPFLILFSVMIPFAACRIICRESVVDRLREAEG